MARSAQITKIGIFCIGVLARAAQAQGIGVSVGTDFPPESRPALQLIANEEWAIARETFGPEAPLALPIHCYYNARTPITHADDWGHPTRLLIGLKPSPNDYGQFAYQLGHEIGHVMLDPRRTCELAETLATAFALEVLDRLGERLSQFSMLKSRAAMRPYAGVFRVYRETVEEETALHAPPDIGTAIQQKRWQTVKLYVERIRLKRLDRESQAGRDFQATAAILLRSKNIDWKNLRGLAGCTTPSPKTSPLFAVLEVNMTCLSQLAGELCRIGIGCSGVSGNQRPRNARRP